MPVGGVAQLHELCDSPVRELGPWGGAAGSQFAVDVRTGCEATKISPDKNTVELRNVATGAVTTESYDKLVLSPGAPSIRPGPVPQLVDGQQPCSERP